MSNTIKENKTLDLKKVRQIIFNDINVLLDDLELEYEEVSDNIFMSCPIHEGSDNKQGLSISTTKQAWRCWTRGCHEDLNTDIFGFIRGVMSNRNGDIVTFSDVLRYVCKLYDVNNAKTKAHEKKEESKSDEFSDVVKIFQKKQRNIETSKIINKVKTSGKSLYFEARGFKRETLKHFGVEDCSDNFCDMRHRSIIPIYNMGIEMGYIARATKEWLQPKYLFSSGLVKTNYLYNHDNAMEIAREKSCLFLVEGQGDVWKLHEAGVLNAVGLFGKDIDSQHSLLIKSGVTTLVILTDNDQAGREAKIKINRKLSRLFNLKFPDMPSNDLGIMSIEKIKSQILTNLQGYY